VSRPEPVPYPTVATCPTSSGAMTAHRWRSVAPAAGSPQTARSPAHRPPHRSKSHPGAPYGPHGPASASPGPIREGARWRRQVRPECGDRDVLVLGRDDVQRGPLAVVDQLVRAARLPPADRRRTGRGSPALRPYAHTREPSTHARVVGGARPEGAMSFGARQRVGFRRCSRRGRPAPRP
jgi:hypothetical protein